MGVSVSIVMPVYNASVYLEKSLNSILKQSLQSWELIAIDDGSVDDSGLILDRYSRIDSRFRVYHTENYGVAKARAFGLSLVKGQYIIHVDSDDWIEPDYLELLYAEATRSDSDMVVCDAFKNDSDYWDCTGNIADSECMIRSLLLGHIWGSLWNRLIRISICQKEDVGFPINKRVHWAEDTAFCISVLRYCKTITIVKKALYHYNTANNNSLLHSVAKNGNPDESCYIVDFICEQLTVANVIDKYKKEVLHLKLSAIRDYIDNLNCRDTNKFVCTYPEAIAQIWSDASYPLRLKLSSWLILHRLSVFVPLIWRILVFIKV